MRGGSSNRRRHFSWHRCSHGPFGAGWEARVWVRNRYLPVLAGDVVAPEQEAGVANGLSYIDFLGDVAEVFGALR